MHILYKAILLAHALAASAVLAQPAYPNKPITLVVAYPAGGSTDIVARKWGEELTKKLGQPVVVENAAGAGGAIGARRVARAPADGYTLLLGSVNELVLSPLTLKTPLYKPSDFRAVMIVGTSPVALLASPKKPLKSMADIAAAGKNKQQIFYGTPGKGTFHHVVMHSLAQRMGIEMTHVPYKGGAPFMADAIGGQIDLVVSPIVSAVPAVSGGQLTGIAVSSLVRSEAMPTLPTLAESSKALQGVEYTIWAGVFAPAGTPTPIVDRLNTALREVQHTDSIRAFLRATGSTIPSSATDLWGAQRFVDAEDRKYRAIVPALDLQD